MQTAERCLRAPSIAVAFRHAQCADECPAFGRKADSGQPLLTNLDLRVHGLECAGGEPADSPGAMKPTLPLGRPRRGVAWASSQYFRDFPPLAAMVTAAWSSVVVRSTQERCASEPRRRQLRKLR